MDTLTLQIQAFAVVILAGLTCGVFFDIYRVIRSLVRMRGLTTTIADIVFWLFVTPTVLMYLTLANWLELRFYVLLGIVLGLFLYFMVFSSLVLQLVFWLTRGIGYIFSGLFRALAFMVLAPCALLSRLFYRLQPPGPRTNHRLSLSWRAPLRWRKKVAFPPFWWRHLARKI